MKRILGKCAYRDLNWLNFVTVVLTAAYPGKPLSHTSISIWPIPHAGTLLRSAAD